MNPPDHPATADPLTAGQIASRINRSRYGVKKCIERLGFNPKQVLNGISYFDPAIEQAVVEAMRGPNLKPAKD